MTIHQFPARRSLPVLLDAPEHGDRFSAEWQADEIALANPTPSARALVGRMAEVPPDGLAPYADLRDGALMPREPTPPLAWWLLGVGMLVALGLAVWMGA